MLRTHYLNTGTAIVFSLLAGLMFFFAASTSVSAATCTFASVGDNDFNTAGNWDCAHVPIAADYAIIPTGTTTAMSAPATISGLRIDTGATLTTTGQDLTINDSASSSGALIAGGANTISIGNDLYFLSGFTFTPGDGTVKITTSTSDGSFYHELFSATAVTYNDLTVSSSQVVHPLCAVATINVGGDLTVTEGTLYLGDGNDLTVAGTSNLATDGVLSMEDSDSVFTSTGTTTNNGTIGPLSDGILILSNVINNGTILGSAGETYSLTVSGSWSNAGTFNSGSSTVAISGSVPQTISGDLIFYNLTTSGDGSSIKTFYGNVTTTGDLVNSGFINLSNKHLEPMGNVTNSFGIYNLTLRVASGKNQTWNSFGSYNAVLIVEKPTGTTLTITSHPSFWGMLLISGTVNAGPGTIDINGNGQTITMAGGTFEHGGGTIKYSNSGGTINVASTTYNNLILEPSSASAAYNLSGTTTVAGTTSLSEKSKLNLQGETLIAGGPFTNSGLITLNGGKIVHAAESVKITDSSGTEVSSISSGGSLYVTVQDSNRNLASSTVETMTVTITTDATAGSDSETLTLTETSSTSGIFRNTTALNVVNSTVSSPGNNQIEIKASGIGTVTYTDNQDATDTANDTVTLTYTSSAVTPTGSGGGGSGDPYVTGIPPLSTQAQQLLDNLKNINVAVHNLVKLPDDGDITTQEDTAVYYIGADGMRHAFPNSKIYFTWYCDFSDIMNVSAAVLAQIPLGKNVSYRPGLRMVKFTTDPKVYAVTVGGVLHWVNSEELAIAIYGADWNKNIDDISDAFYSNYTFGADIENAADFDAGAEANSITYPSENMNISGVKPSVNNGGFICVVDADNDGLTYEKELEAGTDPKNTDSDGDGLTDGQEVNVYHTDPLKMDTDGDELKDAEEIKIYGTDPLKTDTDGDTYSDSLEISTNNDPLGTGICKTYRCIIQ
ncbi:MAG: binary toxin-like calcium binding domain-containing protein [Patescibacteria group bacterium]